jgi:GntR family transcriptional regulator
MIYRFRTSSTIWLVVTSREPSMSHPAPMYAQIAADLRRKIEDGELPPGAQLPSEVELRDEYAQDGRVVSRNTIRDAIRILISRGLIETRPGQGTFVLRKMRPFVSKVNMDPDTGGVEDEVYESEVKREGRTPEATRPRVEVHGAADVPGLAPELELKEDQQVVSRHQERRIDGTPWSMQTTFYPMDFAVKAPHLLMAENIPGGTVKYLQERLGIRQAGWRDAITARPPSGNERAFFGLSDKVQVAILEFRRTGYDEDSKPFRLTVTVYPADRNKFELEVGRVPPPKTSGTEPTEEPGRVSNRSG